MLAGYNQVIKTLAIAPMMWMTVLMKHCVARQNLSSDKNLVFGQNSFFFFKCPNFSLFRE